jgi:undecaprenyl diphosphate synthase
MDGNGRWAKQRGLPRTAGHYEGLTAAKNVVRSASEMGLSYLTLYVFSTENWKRTSEEVGFIMGLVKRFLRGEMDFYRQNRIRIRHTGDLNGLPSEIRREIEDVMADTEDFPGLQVVLALNYGGRDEILRAVERYTQAAPGRLDEAEFRQYFDNPDIPDPDLIIRTAGEFRTSNFLLWEGAYAEYYISDKFWPDFSPDDFKTALAAYQGRERRYGGAKT